SLTYKYISFDCGLLYGRNSSDHHSITFVASDYQAFWNKPYNVGDDLSPKSDDWPYYAPCWPMSFYSVQYCEEAY
ncbi:MAG TPA: hypothetical protein P5214_09015, partial [Rectinema sp.]|nr:hypothetical protein [Rectinema sp.]